ncbi:MAG: hypothetical protein Q7K45_02900 [Nanoarchaeota archaeon]|nr:hypothetical protein [Nanoarchaeota archaeon]
MEYNMRLKDDAPQWLKVLARKVGLEDSHTTQWKGLEYTILRNTYKQFEIFISGIQFHYYSAEDLVRAVLETRSAPCLDVREAARPCQNLYDYTMAQLEDGESKKEVGISLAVALNDACLGEDIFRGVLLQYPLFQAERAKKPSLCTLSAIKRRYPPYAAQSLAFSDNKSIPVFGRGSEAESWNEANTLARGTIDAYLDHKDEITAILPLIDRDKILIFKTPDLYSRHLLLESWGWKFLYTTPEERREYRELPT